MIAGEYNNLVLEQFGTEFMYTLNGVVISTITNAGLTTIGNVFISCDSAAGTVGSLHIDNVQIGVVHVQTARDPSPENGAMHADTWVNLSWSPGNFAASHDVYFGEDFDDVDNGAGDSFRGNQADTNYIVGFPGFPYPEGLVPGTTYYWRVDEVNEADRMYVTLDGAPVYHDDPAVTQTSSWTEWVVDLTQFADQGVNLANVNAITIGIGTKGSPAAGGAGTMHFDDIRLTL